MKTLAGRALGGRPLSGRDLSNSNNVVAAGSKPPPAISAPGVALKADFSNLNANEAWVFW